MLLHSTIFHSTLHHHVSLSSPLPHSLSSPPTFLRTVRAHKNQNFRYSISKVHSYGAVDYENRPPLQWSRVYKRILFLNDPEKGAAAGVLDQCEKEGKRFTKWELCKIIKELRKVKRFQYALEVDEWMNNRAERFRITTSDAAIRLDLIAKVRGILSAEAYFLKLPDTLLDKRTYGALLNAYAKAKLREKAESLMEKMKVRGYATLALSFNVMMTLYMNLQDFVKVDLVTSEMRERNVPLDTYCYNIWLASCGARGSVEKLEQVFEQMKLETSINPNWHTYSTLATAYIKLGQLKKAEDCLKNVETRITGRDRIPYHYLISLYGSVSKREDVYRVWNVYKSMFPNIPNFGYHAMISSLVRLGDTEGAEQLYQEWLSVKTNYDPRVANLLMGLFVRNGLLEKADALFDQMIELGGKPNSGSWEILAEGQIRKKRMSEALSCLKEAVSIKVSKGSDNWKPRPANVASILKMCKQNDDMESKDVLVGLLSQAGCLEDEAYMSHIPLLNGTVAAAREVPSMEIGITDGEVYEDEDGNGAEMLLNQPEGIL